MRRCCGAGRLLLWTALLCVIYAGIIIQAQDCHEECNARVILDEDDFDVACNDTCRIQKCYEGCDSWMEAASSSCNEVCEENRKASKEKRNYYCVRGCNIAISIFIDAIEDELGTPAQPYLVADTRTNDSVTIQWTPGSYENVSYLVQWRYESPHLSTVWEYYKPSNILKKNHLKVEDLHPYTKYRFRVAWIFLKNYPPLFSEESIVISTLPYGKPSTSPSITSVTTVSCSRFTVSWDPPLFPNGPILSYFLNIQEYPSGFKIIKDVPYTSGRLYYMFNNLKPETTYIISITTINNIGEGPADTKNITTPSKKVTSSDHHAPPYLVFAANQNVLKQEFLIHYEPSALYKSANDSIVITGVALHVEEDLFFVSDSLGNVYRISLTGEKVIDTIISASENNPAGLSIDWLNGKLYMAEENQISRCDLKGNDYEVVINNIDHLPEDMHVDPYNGYLYWALSDAPSEGGLYRVDLIELDAGVLSVERAQNIVKDNDLLAFAVDYKNFRILLPSVVDNTVFSVALDGSDVTDIRSNSQSPEYTNVRSIAIYHDRLYWTTGTQVFGEEYHEEENMFYHNAYLIWNEPFSSINIHHSEYQPYPVPLNPVESVQAVFGNDRVIIRFLKPRLLGGRGKGSWQKWFYEVHLFDHKTELTVIEDSNIDRSSYEILNLQPDRTYSIQIRAKSPGGKGPWSSKFTGSTLKYNVEYKNSHLLWGAQEGLLKSNFIGDQVEHLMHRITVNNAYVTDISWYDSMMFFSTNASMVYAYNRDRHSLSKLQNVTKASSIAVDWLTPKLYWSSPAQQMISRSNIDSSQPEPLPILTMAKEIAIDAVNGYLYWSTSHSVECSRLNGMDPFVYMKNDLFSGKHVMGLTLDLHHQKIYWMVRSYEGSLIYRAAMADGYDHHTVELMGPLNDDNICNSMWYFHDRLFWIQENQQAAITDVRGQNFAAMEGPGLNGITALEIIDPSLHPYPDGLNKQTINVIPSSIVEKNIDVNGTWDAFSITWKPVSSVNYGTVFYEIKVDDGDENYSLITEEPVFVYPSMKHLPPYTPLTVAIKSFTYWSFSRQTVVSLYSPMSSPSKPLNPRIFITYSTSSVYGNQEIQASFRWSPPETPNGIISGYIVTCWFLEDNEAKDFFNDSVNGQTLQVQKHSLLPNTTYYFYVQALTKVGKGPISDIENAKTSHEHPVPQLLLARNNAVEVADIDAHEEKVLNSRHPSAIAYLAQEKRVYWVEEGGALMVSSLDGTNMSLIRQLSSEGTSLTVDWVGKQLFWTEVNKNINHSNVWSDDLSDQSYYRFPKKILNSSFIINNIEVEPFSRSLIWTAVMNKDNCRLMICDVDGSNIRPFFRKPVEYERISKKTKIKRMSESSTTCNCFPTSTVGKAITIDSTNSSRPEILFVDGKYGHIWSSDLDGCICKLLVNATQNMNNGLPPNSLTVDGSRIYWSNKTLGRVYSINKYNQETRNILDYQLNATNVPFLEKINSIITEEMRGIRSIRAIGEHLQPYPDALCLVSEQYKEIAQLVSQSQSTITLYLPPVKRPLSCAKISAPSARFTVFYSPVDNTSKCFPEQQGLCKSVDTYNNTLTIYNLNPFKNYSFRVSVRNYYSKKKSLPGPEVVYRTSEGAPSAPVNVTAIPVTPFRIDVSWYPSIFPNGDQIGYEVRWSANPLPDWRYHSVNTSNHTGEKFTASISTSDPGRKHRIVVRAFSSNGGLHNDSDEVVILTYERPQDLIREEYTSTQLALSWLPPRDQSVSHYRLEFKKASKTQWLQWMAKKQISSAKVLFEVDALSPKTSYNFRLILTYGTKELIWPRNSSDCVFKTEGDVPDPPGRPQLKYVGKDIYQVFWEESHNNGFEELKYELQRRSSDVENIFDGWLSASNTSINHWTVESITGNVEYEFRVRAINEFGVGNFSVSEKKFYLQEPGAFVDPVDDPSGIIIAASIAILVVLSISFISLYIMHHKKEKDKKIIQEIPSPNHLVSDFELATLQDLPRHVNFVHETNALYNLRDLPADEELITLPQIQRNQIIIDKKLGSGAFGDVYEGTFELDETSPAYKIAIKTLKKGATNNEKEEFLKEAVLMSNFKHKHILKLLGVCFDNNMNFMILELMEGGDLLSFLRSNNPTLHQVCNLTMNDLLSICIDVAEGCKYLQEMHFVHRDLAARNCLVSCYNRENRIVKIGDFGLARDIYKSDYYRKDGEGLLPVRWMPPESLELGIFTCQSDVWAFGVLLWEVMTLGQQPYAARKNVEVFHYVKRGGRLDKPENCPVDLHEIMKSCWRFKPENRCSFSYCLDELLSLRTKMLLTPVPISSVFNFNYIDANIGGYIGTTVAINDDHEKELEPIQVSLLSQANPSTSHDMGSFTQQTFTSDHSGHSGAQSSAQRTNKYLELLADNEDAEGYQLPFQARTLHTCNNKQCDMQQRSSDPVVASAYMQQVLQGTGAVAPLCSEEESDQGSVDSASFQDWDVWSLSAASTATYQMDSLVENRRHSGISTLSSLSGVDLNYESKSTCC